MESISVIPDADYAAKKWREIMELVKRGSINPHYPNSLRGHIVGRMGEDGTFEYLKRRGLHPFPNYQFGHQGCDIFLQKTGIRLEVKSWLAGQFEWGGRAIAEKQLPLVRKKADRIVWCTVDLGKKEVCVVGWSEVSDFNNAPLVTKGKLNLRSYQLETVREMESF